MNDELLRVYKMLKSKKDKTIKIKKAFLRDIISWYSLEDERKIFEHLENNILCNVFITCYKQNNFEICKLVLNILETRETI